MSPVIIQCRACGSEEVVITDTERGFIVRCLGCDQRMAFGQREGRRTSPRGRRL